MTATPILFLHSAGPQSATEGSGPLLARLRSELPGVPITAPALPTPEDHDPAAWEVAGRSAISGHERPVVVVGHSLGGSVATADEFVMADHAERLDAGFPRPPST